MNKPIYEVHQLNTNLSVERRGRNRFFLYLTMIFQLRRQRSVEWWGDLWKLNLKKMRKEGEVILHQVLFQHLPDAAKANDNQQVSNETWYAIRELAIWSWSVRMCITEVRVNTLLQIRSQRCFAQGAFVFIRRSKAIEWLFPIYLWSSSNCRRVAIKIHAEQKRKVTVNLLHVCCIQVSAKLLWTDIIWPANF
jgi:hypothetical protein